MIKFNPHSYQQHCIDRILNSESSGLFLDMGLGKTVITLTAIQKLRYDTFEVNKTLVIAPLKVAQSTWNRECEKWDHLSMLRVSPVLGSLSERKRGLSKTADIYIINRENVPWLVDYYKSDWPFDCVVIDELSSFKSHKAKRFKALTYVRRYINRIIGLTGTPCPNGLLDLWSQVYLLDRGERLETGIGKYRARYFDERRTTGFMFSEYRPKKGAFEAIMSKISDICLSMSAKDYLELPECVYNTVPVALDDVSKKHYTRFKDHMVLEYDGDTIDAMSAAVLSNKLLQLCNGAVYDVDRKVVEVHKCKIEALLELIEGLVRRPAILFYNYQHDRDRIIAALRGSGVIVRELKTPQDEQDWNAGKIHILLAHPASAAYGLNLQDGGNHIIWFSVPWALELYLQANARLHRQGQTKRVIIHHLCVVGGLDERVMSVLEDKDKTQNSLLEGLKSYIGGKENEAMHKM